MRVGVWPKAEWQLSERGERADYQRAFYSPGQDDGAEGKRMPSPRTCRLARDAPSWRESALEAWLRSPMFYKAEEHTPLGC